MQRILITNAKGGCGKTTLATNLASYFASKGYGTALFDYDDQLSSMRWLRRRPDNMAAIHGVDASKTQTTNATRSWLLRMPDNTEYAIIDTAAGLKGEELARQLHGIESIIVPVLPSAIDIQATADFIRDLLLIGKVRERGIRLGIVANRVRINTLSFQSLERFLRSLNIPVIAQLRDTQNYNRAAEQGYGIHELKSSQAKKDTPHWENILEWLKSDENSTTAKKRA